MSTHGAARGESRPSRGLIVWLSVLTVLVLATAGATLYLVLRPTEAPAATGQITVGTPVILSEADLRAFGSSNGTVYWAGPQDGMLYELTWTSSGNAFVRYLPSGTEAGDPSTDFLSVATYSVAGGYDLLAAAGNAAGATATVAQSTALIVIDSSQPNRAYFSFPGSNFQVEVYSPKAGVAEQLVDDGTIVTIR